MIGTGQHCPKHRCTATLLCLRSAVQITLVADGAVWQLAVTNTGPSMDAATLAAFTDADSPAHASRDPFSRMKTGLRFAAHVVRLSGGALTATWAGAGRSGECTVTVRLPRGAGAAPLPAPTVVLADGTTSLQVRCLPLLVGCSSDCCCVARFPHARSPNYDWQPANFAADASAMCLSLGNSEAEAQRVEASIWLA